MTWCWKALCLRQGLSLLIKEKRPSLLYTWDLAGLILLIISKTVCKNYEPRGRDIFLIVKPLSMAMKEQRSNPFSNNLFTLPLWAFLMKFRITSSNCKYLLLKCLWIPRLTCWCSLPGLQPLFTLLLQRDCNEVQHITCTPWTTSTLCSLSFASFQRHEQNGKAMQTALLTGFCQGSVWMLADLNGYSREPSTNLYLYDTAQAGSFDNTLIFFKFYLLLPGQGTEERQLLSLLGCRGVAAGA